MIRTLGVAKKKYVTPRAIMHQPVRPRMWRFSGYDQVCRSCFFTGKVLSGKGEIEKLKD